MDKASSDPVADVVWFDDFRLTELNSYADTDVDTPGTIKVALDVSSVADAKDQPDGTLVKLTNIAVTGYPVDNTTIFYVEDDSRASGIAVDKTNGTGAELNNIVEDDRVTFAGILATVNGERVLTNINVTSRTPDTAPEPLGMTNDSLGGTADGYTPGVEDGVGTNNVGLLVTVWGSINNAATGCFYVDDGSGLTDGTGTGVKIICGSIPVQPGATYASVAGFSSVEENGGLYHRVVRPRSSSDLVWY